MSTVEVLAEVASRTVREATSQTRADAATELLDSVGCMIRGGDHAISGEFLDYARSWHPGDDTEAIAVDAALPLEQAVVLDALACHVDEFDSLHAGSATVPAAVVAAPALHLGRAMGVSGRKVIDAVIAGYQVTGTVAARFGGSGLYAAGWWPTSTFGSLGSAAAAATLLGLDEERTCHALGIASIGSGGLLAGDRLGGGHYLSAARAAAAGAAAALQAKAGVQASWKALDDPARAAFLGSGSDPFPAPSSTAVVSECVTKWYPCARPLHAVVEALRSLRDRYVDLSTITRVEIGLDPGVLAFVTDRRDVIGPTEAAASAAFVVDAVCGGHEAEVGWFREARLRPSAPEVVVEALETDGPATAWSARVRCRTSSGAWQEVAAASRTDADREGVGAKFLANVTAAGFDTEAADDLRRSLVDLDDADDLGFFAAALRRRP
ncbi:MmgE/PrpD family protein [Aeromicrobium piscarium]|uniref:MmgE/PrpD family protein n=1 Tax=Aeromicrobium piscarium TaxID=2590901 RepID=UPI00163D665A|nr:MmgE/PrpD family protein [Aeromicrobium piscarium]